MPLGLGAALKPPPKRLPHRSTDTPTYLCSESSDDLPGARLTSTVPRRYPWLKRAGISLGALCVAVLLIVVGVELWHPASPSYDSRAIQLGSVEVSFVGSGASNASAAAVCGHCGTSSPVGAEFYSFFEVLVPYETYCTPHTWSVTQVAGSSQGGDVVSNVTAAIVGSSGTLPMTIPNCQGGQAYNAASIGYHLNVVDSGPTIQTLYLTVAVSQLS
jgi:hypothetical protein